MKAITAAAYAYPLLANVHLEIAAPKAGGTTLRTRGDFLYFHYACDGHNDKGWGCAYRTLQSICSLVVHARGAHRAPPDVPSLYDIQRALVEIGDKAAAFVGSRAWIGALEVCYALDHLYNVPCKIIHVPCRQDLKGYANILKGYFVEFGGLVMMGGDMDAASKAIAGVHISGNEAYFLVVDPHYVGVPKSAADLIDRGYIRWQHTSQFVDSSFYNLCFPQVKCNA